MTTSRSIDRHRTRWWIGLAALSLGGCAHHYIGWPPTPADLDEVKAAAKNDDGTTIVSLIPAPYRESIADPGSPGQPIAYPALPDVSQIVSADGDKLTVIDKKGAQQVVYVALVDGFVTTNRNRAMRRSTLAGGLAGLAASGVVALCIVELNGLGEDSPGPNGRSAPVAAAIFTVALGTLLGATLGIISGDRNPDEVFQFGWRR